MPRTILMGDPRFFSVRGGANPHTRNALGIRKTVDPELARQQWHRMARTLLAHGNEVFVVPSDRELTGLVYPANAGFLFPLQGARPEYKVFYLANLLPTRHREREIYRPFLQQLGYQTRDIAYRFEGEADFFPAGSFMLFTHGRLEKQRFVPRFGMPPWRRVYGFRSDLRVLPDLSAIAGERPILALELQFETHYHGDTVLCSFGPRREFVLAYMEGLSADSRSRLEQAFGTNLIPLSREDAELYAANSFQTDNAGVYHLFLPEGVSDSLLKEVRMRGVEPVPVNVSEFLAKGGGSIKCMILDLGPVDEQPKTADAIAFREQCDYRHLFPYSDP